MIQLGRPRATAVQDDVSSSPGKVDPARLIQEFVDSVTLWPSGVVSAVGSLTIAAAIFVQMTPGMQLSTAEYLATVIVGGVLTLAGPVTANIQVGTAGRSATKYVAELKRFEELKRRAQESDTLGRIAEERPPRPDVERTM